MSLVDYAIGQSFIESFMIDTCAISRLEGGVPTQVLDPVTGKLIDPHGEPTSVYTGKCIIKKPKLENQPSTIAGQYSNYSVFKVLLPVAVADVQFGDILTVTATRDPAILAHKMRVVDIWAGTHDVYRALWVIDMTTGIQTED